MGYGIEARSDRCRKYWTPHLEYSKNFIRTNLPPGTVVVAGSGRLLDYPVELLQRAKHTTLLDADPASLSYCRKKYGGDRLSYIHREITNSIAKWERVIRNALGSSPSPDLIARALDLLLPETVPAPVSADTVVSLNILGQIPIYWRERLKKIFLRKGIYTDNRDEFPQELEDAVKRSCAKLQEAALRNMIESAQSACILITDLYYHYYEKDHADWQTYSALYFDLKKFLERYTLNACDSWLWHIAPQGIESKEHGVIHEVHAYSFSI